MAGTSWPLLTAKTKAKGSDVHLLLDWIEGDFVPNAAGSKVDATYDLGEATQRWKDLFLSGDIYMESGKKLILNGDTYIYESAANVITAVAGGSEIWRNTGQHLVINDGLYIPTTSRLNLNYAGTTWIYEAAANQIDIYANGINQMTLADGSDIAIKSHTRYYSLSPTDFRSIIDTYAYELLTNGALGLNDNSAGYPGAAAGVHLPHGAVLTDIQYDYKCDNSQNVMYACLYKAGASGTSTAIGATQTGASQTGYQTLADATPNETIDNANNSYYVLIAVAGELSIAKVKITYTITAPLP